MTTSELRIYGASDDLIEVEGHISEEYSKPKGKWTGKLTDDTGAGMFVTADCLKTGTWAIGVAPLDDDAPIPDWEARLTLSEECSYSAQLTLEVPASTILVEVRR